jgi:hypothetical protein
MEPMRIPWATQSYKLASLPVSSQRCVNYYAEKEPPDAKTDIAVLACPGIVPWVTAGTGGIRGFNVMNNILYVVSGDALYSVSVAGIVTLLGSGIGGFSVVSMANNGSQVQIVNGVGAWIYAPSETSFASAATVANGGGSAYEIGDTITIGGGVFSSPAILTVLTLSGSAVATVSVQTPGQYLTQAPNPAPQIATSGIGNGATFDVTYTGPPAGFTDITGSPNLFASNTTTFFDEYFILEQAGSNVWFFSAILDGTTYNALDFETATVESAFVVAIVNQQETLLIFTQKTIEQWYDTGANDNPFARYGAATVERGCAAPYTALKEDNSVFFLGDDLIFYRLNGVLLVRQSTHAIEAVWRTYPTVGDAFAFSYTYAGHKFITVTFPSANATWVFDIATNLWHERVSYVQATPFAGSWRGNCAIEFNNQTLIGDALSGQIGLLSATTYTEFGQPIIGLMDSPPVHKDRKRIFMSKLEINMQTGTGLSAGQGSNPQVMLQVSRDQGQTYKPFQPWQSMGPIGAYLTRLLWKKMGVARDWRFRVMISDPVPRNFISTYASGDLEEV